MKGNVVKIKKPESCRGYPVSCHNHIYLGDAVMTDTISTKVCSKCKVERPASEFHKDKSKKDGLVSTCKQCVIIRNKEYRENNKESVLKYNKEYRKENKKHLSEQSRQYYKNNKDDFAEKGYKYRNNNKEKISKRAKKYRLANIDKILEKGRKYYHNNKYKCSQTAKHYRESNREKCKKRAQEYYQINKNEIITRVKVYYKTNKKQILKRNNSYRLNNKEKINKLKQIYLQTEAGKNTNRKGGSKYRARKRNVKIEDFSPLEVFKRDRYICQSCGIKTRPDYKNPYHPKYPNLDHIIPLSLGGEHSRKNTQCLCRQCNITKNNTGVGDQLRIF